MYWSYDLTGAEPIVRDMRVYSVSGTHMYRGEAMGMGAVGAATTSGCLVIAPAILSNMVGVLQEDLLTDATHVSAGATPADLYGKCIINPFAVYKAKYSALAADINTTTVASATGILYTSTQVTNHFRCWVFSLSGTSKGNLGQVNVVATTASVSIKAGTPALAPVAIGDTFIVTHEPWCADVAGGSVDLATNAIDVSGHDGTGSAGAAVVLENYIVSPTRPMEPLSVAKHSSINVGTDGTSELWADVFFAEHVLLGTYARIIT